MLVLLVASTLEMWAAASLCDNTDCGGYTGWAVSCGVLSVLGCLVMMALYGFANKKSGDVEHAAGWFFFVLWGLGAGICTFKAPFNSACENANGYFASWLSFIASSLYLMETTPFVKDLAHKGMSESRITLYLGVTISASFVVFVASSVRCSEDGCEPGRAWGLCCGLLSMILTGIVLFVPQLHGFVKYYSMFISIWWLCGVATMTFRYKDHSDLGMFSSAGNGFFGSWLALFTSVMLLFTTSITQDVAKTTDALVNNYQGWTVATPVDKPQDELEDEVSSAKPRSADIAEAADDSEEHEPAEDKRMMEAVL